LVSREIFVLREILTFEKFYQLRFDSRCLYDLGNLLSNYLKSQLKNWAVNEAGTWVLGAAFATLALPLKLQSWSGWIDNTWYTYTYVYIYIHTCI